MEVSVFIENIQKAFGEKVQLPFAFWYSDKQINDDLKKINGCFFKEFEKLIGGEPISLSADRIGCMGGKFYTGFSTMNEKMPMFVSSKEKYKKSSELVLDFVEKANVQITTRQYLNISPITELENFNNVVGIFFLATPDMLLGLASWTFYDNNSDDAITAKFGSGCSSIFSEATLENSKNGKRTFIGLFDPSVRRYIHLGDLAGDGSQFRPFIVWFGESVPMIETAIEYAETADIFLIIGTSLNVYPAAGLLNYVPARTPVYLIDPKQVPIASGRKVHVIQKGASEGMEELKKILVG